MKNIDYGTRMYERLDVVGPHILVQRFENEEHKAGDIIIPDSKKYANNKIGVGKILEIGKKAQEETKLNVGDYILFDFYSAFHKSKINVIISFENVMLQLNEVEAKEFLNGSLL